MEHGARTRLMTALVIAVVFGSGLMVGYAVQGDPAAAAAAEVGQPRPGPVFEQMNPTPDQRARIDSILEVHRERVAVYHDDLNTAREQYQENYDRVVRETKEAIAQVFPPDQAEEYRRLLAEADRIRAEERSDRNGHK